MMHESEKSLIWYLELSLRFQNWYKYKSKPNPTVALFPK